MMRMTGTVPPNPFGQETLFKESARPRSSGPALGVEKAFPVPFVAKLALKEKQIQQNVRPVIAVHKWFARRPGTLFRAILLAEFAAPPLSEAYFKPHQLRGIRVADPFMGGGTPLFEANRLGCDIFGWDVNPMAYWVVRQGLECLDLTAYEAAARHIGTSLEHELGAFYRTRCEFCDSEDASVKYFIWAKSIPCEACGTEITLLPGYVLAYAGRHPRHVLICRECGDLTELDDLNRPASCRRCGQGLRLKGVAFRGRCTCKCGHEQCYPRRASGSPEHRMVAIEYHCEACRPSHRGRFLKKPDSDDCNRYAAAARALTRAPRDTVPDDRIPAGDETTRLHRWGYRSYREMFNSRQLLGLGTLGRLITEVENQRLRDALATNLSDLVRYQNMACRYDARALKSLDVFSVHGFPVGLVQCESNLLGIRRPTSRTNVGSGGWSNIVEKFLKAKRYCEKPFEIRYEGTRKRIVPVPGEWIGTERDGNRSGRPRLVELQASSSTTASLPDRSLDAVLTDPPYFANVQYAELMDFCYVWLRKLVNGDKAFVPESTRSPEELTGNVTLNRDLGHFTEGLSVVYRRMERALKRGRPFVFTYHHNTLDAYYPIAVALLDAGLACTASLPCPAEMGGSIHIHGTDSSIVDTVFVCRSTGKVARAELAEDVRGIAALVTRDVRLLQEGGVRVTRGDARCVAYGHFIRLAVWKLRGNWSTDAPTADKLERVGRQVEVFGGWTAVEKTLAQDLLIESRRRQVVCERMATYGESADDDIPF